MCCCDLQERGFCARGDSIVALHRIGNASVIKVCIATSVCFACQVCVAPPAQVAWNHSWIDSLQIVDIK